jgi:hypothetical protein
MKPHAGVSTLLDIPQSKVVPFPAEPMLLTHYERGEQFEPDVHAELLRSAKAVEAAWQFAILCGSAPSSCLLTRLSEAIAACDERKQR